jgi:hypothetical protein
MTTTEKQSAILRSTCRILTTTQQALLTQDYSMNDNNEDVGGDSFTTIVNVSKNTYITTDLKSRLLV